MRVYETSYGGWMKAWPMAHGKQMLRWAKEMPTSVPSVLPYSAAGHAVCEAESPHWTFSYPQQSQSKTFAILLLVQRVSVQTEFGAMIRDIRHFW